MLYHVSYQKNLKKLTPKVPETTINGQEDNSIPRVCCCHNIGNCLKSINPFRGDVLFVYEIMLEDWTNIMDYRDIIEYVPDAEYTKENWILEEVDVRIVGEVEIIEGGYFDFSKINSLGNKYFGIKKVKWKWKWKWRVK